MLDNLPVPHGERVVHNAMDASSAAEDVERVLRWRPRTAAWTPSGAASVDHVLRWRPLNVVVANAGAPPGVSP